MQAPDAADEDPTGRFRHGSWHLGHFDDLSGEWVLRNLTEAGGLVLGCWSHQSFAGSVAELAAQVRGVDDPDQPREWQSSFLLRGDVVGAVAPVVERLTGT